MTEMQNIYTIRRENLRTYLRTHGGATSIAKQLGHANASTLSQLTGTSTTRTLGEKAAREYEQKLSLPVGWLDIPRTPFGVPLPAATPVAASQQVDVMKSTHVDHDLLQFCLETVQATAGGKSLKRSKIASIAVMAYDAPQAVGSDLKRVIEQLVQLAL